MGDNILAYKTGNLSTDIQSVHAPVRNVIKNNESSDDILFRFVESLTSFHQNSIVPENNHFQNERELLQKYGNKASIIRNDNRIDFEVIRNDCLNNSSENLKNSKKDPLFVENENNNGSNDLIKYNRQLSHHLVEQSQLLNRDDSLSSKDNPSDIIEFVVVQNNMGSNVSRGSTKNQSEAANRPRRRTHSSAKPDLTLPITRTHFDPGCDQGYGSERSPEEELPPSSLLTTTNSSVNDSQSTTLQQELQPQSQHNQNQTMISPYQANEKTENECFDGGNELVYDFITEDCTFTVEIVKGSRGLGFSICGGIDTNTAFPGLIRIKRLFPHQAAWSTGKLQTGDIILEANSIPLAGLTNYEALEVLRTLPNDVELLICRPVDEQYKKLSPPTEPPKPPQRQPHQSMYTQTAIEDIGVPSVKLQQYNPSTFYLNDPNFSTTSIISTDCYGEFEIYMIKLQGSLGFTIHKEDESVLGHYVRALVREPATTDGRIKPGDKIVAVNDIPISSMTHEQAVIFLRQSGDVVKLRLYRNELILPDEPPSPTIAERENSFGGSSSTTSSRKPNLRPEAINLLTDLAHKKQNSQGDSTESSNLSTSSSPRRLKRGHKSQSEQDASDSKSSNSNPVYLVSSQTTTLCSDSEQSIDSQCSYIIHPGENLNEVVSPCGKTNRPNYLDLSNSSISDKNSIRRVKYQFGVCNNTFELNNLGNDDLDAPMHMHKITNHHNNSNSSNGNQINSRSSLQPSSSNEFNSLPCDVLLGSSTKYSESEFENDINDSSSNLMNNICHKNPLYQSVHAQQSQINSENGQNELKNKLSVYGNESLLKWKGVVLIVDENEESEQNKDSQVNGVPNEAPESGFEGIKLENESVIGTKTTSENYNFENNSTDEIDSSHNVLKTQNIIESAKDYKSLSVELNRGWNSRLGFSLQPSKEFPQMSYISAIYSDSVAARDGRLRVGDVLISVNEESIENMTTTQIIDTLRIIRGTILITVLRKDNKE